jgi:5-methyltetrahydrofolate--homocysteine methyltransferase
MMIDLKFQRLIQQRFPIIFDGAMGTQIKMRSPSKEDFQGHDGCVEILNITRPELIEDIHREYLLAGAHVVETNTLGANSIKLGEYNLSDRSYEINAAAARVARKAADSAGGGLLRLVCGSLGPTGHVRLSGSPGAEPMSFDNLANVFSVQARGLIDGNADMLLLETQQDLWEIRAAIYGIRKVMRDINRSVPLLVQVSMDAGGRMLLGSDVMAFFGAVGNFTPAALGLNCGLGPREMRPHIEELLKHSPCPVSMMPNAGIPRNIDGKAVYDMPPDEFVGAIVPLVKEQGLAVVGGCCGTTPDHIRALSRALEGVKVAPRKTKALTFVSAGITGIALEEVKKPIIIGERLNAQGSKKTKELVLADDFEELYHVALDQAKNGAAVIDLCMAINERDDEKQTMARLVSFLTQRVETPLCIDSTEAAVFEYGLKACPGAVMINSINLERGGDKARPILSLARDFGCPVIALTIDDEGMAKTVKKKLDLARRIRDLACGEFGLPERFVFVDPLTFTLATGDQASSDAAKTTIEAVFRIRDEMPGLRTVLGVSNVSYGLRPAARRVLNNLMLHHAAAAGLDAAIFNPLHIDSVGAYAEALRDAGENLLFNRTPNALTDFIAFFEGAQPRVDTIAADSGNAAPTAISAEKQLWLKITQRDARGIKELIESILQRTSADEILTTILVPAMAEVGEKMSKGEMILPFVLQAAEIMKESLSILEPHRSNLSVIRGTIVLATVNGDVHDIGKNLVGSILKSQGYRVIDLGKQVPVETIVETALRERPDAIGLSALLVTTSKEMRKCVEAFDGRDLSIPIIIGGAAVNREFAGRIGRFDGDRRYAGGVFFGKDAFEAVRILDTIKNEGAHQNIKKIVDNMQGAGTKLVPQDDSHAHEDLAHREMLVPPFFGTSEVLRWEPRQLVDAIDDGRLFKGHWGGGNLSKEEFDKTCRDTFAPALARLKETICAEGLLDAKAVYGFFSVFTDKENVFILDPGDFHTELAVFDFPRMQKNGAKIQRSIADYFRPEGDVIAIQAVTIGGGLGERARRLLQVENRYSDGFFLNGIGNYLTEEIARRVTAEIQRGLFLPRECGRRYSFGYPGLPGLDEQVKLMELLGVEDRLNITLTTGFQMLPEHSTIGVFVHHPQAEYF